MLFVNKQTKAEHEISDPRLIAILLKDSNFEQVEKPTTETKSKRR